MRRQPPLNVVLSRGDSVGASRVAPAADLAPYVDWIWTSWWDRRGMAPHVVEVLSDTATHLVFEPEGASNVVGVVTRAFRRQLVDVGRVVGVRWKTGAFRPWTRLAARELTDRRMPIAEVIGVDARRAETEIFGAGDDDARAAAAQAFLRGLIPAADENVALVQAIVARLETLSESVAATARHFGLSPRALQRLFADYVGVGPKWVAQRARLIAAAERAGDGAPLAALAAELGYFDQAHLARQYKAVVGRPMRRAP